MTVANNNVLEFHLQLQVMANGTIWKLKFSKKINFMISVRLADYIYFQHNIDIAVSIYPR